MYQFSVYVNESVDKAADLTTEALKAEGFGVLTDIDIQATLKTKLGVDRNAYRLLGACNPSLADQALQEEPEIGVLLPCTVVVRDTGNSQTQICFMNPEAVLTLVDNEKVNALAKQVHLRLKHVAHSLSSD